MKSSVTSRKQRFWALLLAVVMVVGLLPVADVEAKDVAITGSNLENYVPVGTVLSTGDNLTGKYEVQPTDNGSLYVHYCDADDGNDEEDVYSSGETISEDELEDGKRYRQIVYNSGETYPISSYEDLDFENARLDNAHKSDKWIVISEDDAGEYINDDYSNDQVIFLQALPKYNITWENLDGATIYNGNETISIDGLPKEFIPEPNVTIDLNSFKATKENYVFDGWEYKKLVIIPGADPEEQDAYTLDRVYKDVNISNITSTNCEGLDVGNYAVFDGFAYWIQAYNIEFRAKWRPVYTVRFYAQSDRWDEELTDVSGTMDNQIIDEDVDVATDTLSPVGYSRIGYTFDGWKAYKTSVNGGDAFELGIVADKSVINGLLEAGNQYPGTVFDLYAQWAEDLDSTYTIKLNPNYPEAEITSAPYPDAPADITNVKFWESDDETKEYTPASYLLPVEEDLKNDNGDPKHYVLNGWRVANPKEGTEVEDLHTYYGNVTLAEILEEGNVSENNVIEMVADWQSPDYQISFNANNPNSIVIPEGVPTRIPKPPVEDDDPWALNFGDSFTTPDLSEYNSDEYGFAGWVLNPDHAANPDPDELIDKNKEYSISELIAMSDAAAAELDNAANGPQWINYGDASEYVLTGVWKQKHTVTFDYNYPTAFELDKDTTKSYVIDGEKVAEPSPAPSYEGWIFDGWYYDAEDKIPVAIPVIVDRPQNVDGLPNNDNLYAPNPMPNDPGEGDEGDDSWVKYDFDSLVLGDFTLVAKWKPINYVIEFKYNAPFDSSNVIEDQIATSLDETVFPYAYQNADYIHLGWSLKKDSKKAEFDSINTTTVQNIVDKAVDDDIVPSYNNETATYTYTLYGVWNPSFGYVKYDKNAEDADGVMEPQKYHIYESQKLLNNLFVRPGYAFAGWTLNSETSEVDYKDGEEYILFPDQEGIVDDITLYAVWVPTHTVTWVGENGEELITVIVPDGEEDPDPSDFPGEQPYEKSGDDKDNYDLGWITEKDNDGDITYKAQFKLKKYTVTFVDENGTTVLKAATEYEYGTKAASIVKPANPTKSGYTFNGWTPAIADVTGNATYTATYTQNASGGGDEPKVTYTITWKNYNGSVLGTAQVDAGTVPAYNGTPTRAADADYTYTFNGWTPDIVAAAGDATYTAKFTATKKQNDDNNNNVTTPTLTPEPTPTATPTPEPTPTVTPTPVKPAEYDIEYYEELADGTVVPLKKTNNPDKYTYGVGAEIKYGIDKEGYTFEGWYSKRSKKYVKKVGTKTKGTVKLYAIFVPDDSGNGNEGDNGKGLPTDFSTLFVRLIDYTENSMTLKWEKMEYVDGYDIFGSRCNSKDVIRPYEPITSVDADTDEYVMSDLLAKTYYKFYVRAYILVNGEKRYITTSINVHGVTLNDTYGVADELEIEKVVVKYINGKSKTKYVRSTAADDGEINITLKVGQSLKIVTSEYNKDGKEIRAHRPISFESSNPNICKVGKKSSHKYGVVVADKANTYKSHTITALAAGECDIYAFAQNGVYKKIHVTVK